jgi:hypothetical protein
VLQGVAFHVFATVPSASCCAGSQEPQIVPDPYGRALKITTDFGAITYYIDWKSRFRTLEGELGKYFVIPSREAILIQRTSTHRRLEREPPCCGYILRWESEKKIILSGGAAIRSHEGAPELQPEASGGNEEQLERRQRNIDGCSAVGSRRT